MGSSKSKIYLHCPASLASLENSSLQICRTIGTMVAGLMRAQAPSTFPIIGMDVHYMGPLEVDYTLILQSTKTSVHKLSEKAQLSRLLNKIKLLHLCFWKSM